MSRWPNFTEKELACSHCGSKNPNPQFIELMDKVQELRTKLGFSLPITSAYRCSEHPIEKNKSTPGQHYYAAVDIGISRHLAFAVLKTALEMGFTGIGVNQKGRGRFIHLDIRENPTVWSY